MSETSRTRLLLERAESALYAAESAANRIKTGDDLREIQAAWSAFLDEYCRAFKFVSEANQNEPGKRLSDSAKREQRSNGVLSYLLHARNANGHGLKFVSSAVDEYVQIESLYRGRGGRLRNNKVIERDSAGRVLRTRILDADYTMSNGKMEGHISPDFQFHEQPKYLNLYDVEDRGVKYSVPNPDTPEGDRAIEMCDFAIKWLKFILLEAKRAAS